jgi:general transcription factor IIIA
MNTKCATCDAPLDNSEQLSNIENPEVYCTQNREADHLPVGCLECDRKYPSLKAFKSDFHANYSPHYSFRCAISECFARINPYQVASHFRQHHPNEQYRCAQCNLGFDFQSELDRHGDETMHAAYICRYPECGSECTRIAELHRHQLIHKSTAPRHACLHCRK